MLLFPSINPLAKQGLLIHSQLFFLERKRYINVTMEVETEIYLNPMI